MPKRLVFCVLFALLSGAAFGQTITVTSPRSGDTWRVGETHAITWTKSGVMDDEVKVLLFQSGARVLEIADRVPNSGSSSWTIPASVAPGQYVVRVRTIDSAVIDNSDEFAIAGPASSGGSSSAGPLHLVSPNGKENIIIGRPFRITWDARPGGPADALVDLALWREGKRVGILAQGIPLKAKLFDWTAGRFQGGAAPAGDGYTVRIQVRGASAEDESDRGFVLAAEAEGDLELVAVENQGNKVAARIKSTFPRFADTVMYEMRRPGGATPFRYPLSMLFEGPGEKVYTMETIIPSRPTDADYCCSTYEMSLDTTNRIEETNEQNNHQTGRLYGNPTFAIIDAIKWGAYEEPRDPQRGQTFNVHTGRIETIPISGTHGGQQPWRVIQHLAVFMRNCGYDRIMHGELRVSQVGELFPDERPGPTSGGFLPSHRTVVLLRQTSIPYLGAYGKEMHFNTDVIAFHPVPSEIIVEYIWEDEGVHSDFAVFRFNIDFRNLLDRPTPKP